MFNVNDWAIGNLNSAAGTGSLRHNTDYGLVESDGASMVQEGEHNADATLFNVGFAGEWTTTGPGAGTILGTNADANVIMDAISPGICQRVGPGLATGYELVLATSSSSG